MWPVTDNAMHPHWEMGQSLMYPPVSTFLHGSSTLGIALASSQDGGRNDRNGHNANASAPVMVGPFSQQTRKGSKKRRRLDVASELRSIAQRKTVSRVDRPPIARPPAT